MILCKFFFCFCSYLSSYFIFLKNRPKTNLKSFNTKFRPQWKSRKSGNQVRQILAHFCNLIALILGWNCTKGIRVTKIVKEIKFEWVLVELGAKNCFQRKSLTKYLRLILVFMRKSALREKFNFCFWTAFC